MPLESATYINGLNSSNPTGADTKAEGDDHIRLIKSAVKATFPNLTGAVTADQTELNILDGATLSTAELNLLDGVTASTAELNLLDGVTATTTEINYIDGVTSPIQTQLAGKADITGETYTGTHDFSGATSVKAPTKSPGSTGNDVATVDYANALAFSSTLPGYSSNAKKVLAVNATETSAEWVPGNPSGMVAMFAGASAPDGWLICDGSTVSRSTYAALFTAIGTVYGAGDGSTTFKIPDLRGEFVRGLDGGRGVDTGRALGSAQSSANLSHSHGGSVSGGSHAHDGTISNTTGGGTTNAQPLLVPNPTNPSSGTMTATGSHTHTINADGGTESRPRNIAMNYIIKI